MTAHERELGTLGAQLADTIHKQRNMRMVLDSVIADYHELQREVSRQRTMIKTVLSVLGVAVGVLAWLIELALRS